MLARCDVMLCDGFYSNSNSFIFAASYISIQLIIIFLFPVLNDAVLSPHTSATPSPPSFLLPPPLPLSAPSHIKTQDQESHPSYSRAQ